MVLGALLSAGCGGGGEPPVTPTPVLAPTAGASPEPAPPESAPPVASTPIPAQATDGGLTLCTPEAKQPGMCTKEYLPVCVTVEGSTVRREAGNACEGCKVPGAVSFVPGECPREPR